MKILFCASEVAPFAKTGGLADVCGTLPLALEKRGIEIILTLPRYQCVDVKKFQLKRIDDDFWVTKIGKGISVYFIEHEKYFGRKGIYGSTKGGYPDNLERFSYYCRKSLELIKKINFKAEVVHCHDWQTALIAVYLKFIYGGDAFYKKVKSVLTIHNLAYQGLFTPQEFLKLGLPQELYSINGFEFYNKLNLLKGGIIFSDYVTTVSRTYAVEIQTDTLGCGLAGVLRARKNPLAGILNGIDDTMWNPTTDPWLQKRYSSDSLEHKYQNKERVQKDFKLPTRSDAPLFGFVGRLSAQKGLDLLWQAVDEIASLDLQMVILGTGEEKYHRLLKRMARRCPKKIAVGLEYNEPLAHRIYAGCDIFLMPSVYEPCGLSQMISLKYGTIPLVFKTGGLAETVIAFNSSNAKGNGFVFDRYDKNTFLKTVKKAVAAYKNKTLFRKLIERAFTYDFSWDESARGYQELYQRCVQSV